MKYLFLECNGFKHFRLHDIRFFRITMSELVQLVLGTNGCGKSSLLREMTGLPPDPNDYYKDGSKKIGISDKGNIYILSSTFNPVKHSFKKNDVEMNPGGTRDAQRKLCFQEFKITPEIHAMLLGDDLFTSMGPGKRREWVMRLSNNNYDYALNVYNKLRDSSNEIAVMLRATKKRMVEEQSKVISDVEEKKLNDEVNQIHRDLNLLMENRAPVTKPVESYQKDQERMLAELAALTKRLYKVSFSAPKVRFDDGETPVDEWGHLVQPEYHSIEEINGVISHIQHRLTVCDTLLNKAMKEHEKYSGQFKILEKAGAEGLSSLHEKMKKLMDKKLLCLSNCLLNNVPNLELYRVHPDNGLGAWESVCGMLQELFMSIPENSERQYGSDILKNIEEQILSEENKKGILVQAATKLQARKAHMDSHKENQETVCPKCTHHWRHGYDERQYQALSEQIAIYEEKINQHSKTITDLKERAQTNREYGEMYRSYVRTTAAWPVLNPLWNFLGEEKFLTHKPRALLPVLDKIHHDLSLMKDASKIDDEMLEVSNLIAAAEKLGDATLHDVREKLEDCALDVERFTADRNILQRNYVDYNAYLRQVNEGLELGRKIEAMQEAIMTCNGDMVEMMRRETIAACTRQLQTTLARKEEVLSYVTLQKALVADMGEQISILTIKDEAAKLLVKELGPKEGLIAEGLLGFIKHFITQMNNLIRKIWAYPMVLLDCVLGDEGSSELDYKFPLMIEDVTPPVPDINKGSDGQKDVINMVFKICSMQHLGLGETPLYLDEPGATFDAEHRRAMSIVINSLMEQESFTQLFMISHYESSYGSMTNAEICVLCPSNITVPGGAKYNQHVSIN